MLHFKTGIENVRETKYLRTSEKGVNDKNENKMAERIKKRKTTTLDRYWRGRVANLLDVINESWIGNMC
jgi:hypothetical protein